MVSFILLVSWLFIFLIKAAFRLSGEDLEKLGKADVTTVVGGSRCEKS